MDIGLCQKEVRKPHHSELLFLDVRVANSRKLKFVSRRKTEGKNFCCCTRLINPFVRTNFLQNIFF